MPVIILINKLSYLNHNFLPFITYYKLFISKQLLFYLPTAWGIFLSDLNVVIARAKTLRPQHLLYILVLSTMEILNGKTIMVVDDEEFNWLLFKSTLDDIRADFVWARVAQEAIDIVASGRRIDRVLMDIKMPIKDGYQATREIKEINVSLPVIAQTAYCSNEEMHRCREAGCDDYITKPIDFEELKRKMVKILKSLTP